MLETLTNLKNNKTKRAATQQVRGDTTERLKKFLAGLGKTRHRELSQVVHRSVKLTLSVQWFRTTR